MSGKNLTFKLIMDGDSKGLVGAAKQSERVVTKVFEVIKTEAEMLKQASADTAKEIGNIIPKNANERASILIKSLNETTEIIKSTGTGVIGASESFNKFGVDSVRSLNLLKANLSTAKTKLEEFAKTNATPEDIAKAQQQINALEKEVQQADLAFGSFKSELSLITPEAAKLDTELGKTNAELQKNETLVKQASVEIQGLKTGYTALTSAMAALGVSVSAAEIGRTADEFKVLEARIGLATSKSGNFTEAFEGVKKIAIETRSNLTATAELFTRVKSAVDQLGYSQERALGITDLVNKSLIVGGGLAASNEAAIYQFNQALQSGVLRGEEFNSVMEQAPRLAQALADGLGVNVGKLREMAGQGQLTSKVIVKALESQSKALNEEFAKMPVTIGQSIENLKTAWTLYIGEADAATGASAKVAEALKFVAENLDQIVSTLVLAGQAFIAYKALNIASVFLDKAAGVRAASVAITQETTAVVANTQAQIANATATKSAAASKVQLAANSASATTASIATSGSIMTLISRLGALGVAVTAVGVLIPTVFQPIGTAIGEGIAKGVERAEIAISNLGTSVGDANRKVLTSIEQLESQMKAEEAAVKAAAEVKQSFALAAEKARDKTYQLTVESKKLVTEFDELIKKGEPTKDALDKISNAMKFDSTKGINDSITALILLRDQGKITAEQLQLEFGKALDGKDLTVFQTNAKAAFAGTAQEAAKSAALTEAVMKAALSRTGLDTEQLKGRFSETFKSAANDVKIIIDNLDAYKAQGIDTGIALSTNLNNAINTAQTGAELDYAKGKLVEYGRQGLITGEQVALGLGKIEQKLTQLPDTLNPAQAAFSAMGLKTQAQLDSAAQSAQANFDVIRESGQATAEGIQSAYELMLNATIASGNKAKIAVAQAKAASLGLEVQMDATGKATVAKLGEIQQAASATQQSIQQVSRSNPATDSKPANDGLAGQDFWEEFKAERAKINEATKARMALVNGKGGGNFSQLAANPAVSAMAPSVEPVSINTEPLEATSFGTVQVDLRTDSGTKPVQVMAGSEQNLLDALAEMKKRS